MKPLPHPLGNALLHTIQARCQTKGDPGLLTMLFWHCYSYHQVRLQVNQEALNAIAQLAMERKTGARGLRAIMVGQDILLVVAVTVQTPHTGSSLVPPASSQCCCSPHYLLMTGPFKPLHLHKIALWSWNLLLVVAVLHSVIAVCCCSRC